MITEIILNRKLLKQIIDESIAQNKEILVVFYNNSKQKIIGDSKQVGDVNELLTIPGRVSLVFHTHLSLNFQNRDLVAYPSVNDVEMSVFLSNNYSQYKGTIFAIGSLVNGKYLVCYWSPDTINFSLLNSVESRILNGENTEENRKLLGDAVGLQCLDLDMISLTTIADQEQLNFYRRIDSMIKDYDTVVFEENISEIKDAIERMYPVLFRYYDYVNDTYKGIVYVYYLLLSVENRKVKYAKMMVYGDKRIEIVTMTVTDENIIRIGNKEYRLEELKELCKGYCNQE